MYYILSLSFPTLLSSQHSTLNSHTTSILVCHRKPIKLTKSWEPTNNLSTPLVVRERGTERIAKSKELLKTGQLSQTLDLSPARDHVVPNVEDTQMLAAEDTCEPLYPVV